MNPLGAMLRALRIAAAAILLPVLLAYAKLRREPPERRTLVWGPVPLMNHHYWSAAMRAVGQPSVTLMRNHFARINRREDFDLYFEDLLPRWVPRGFRQALGPLAALTFILRRASILHMPFCGGPLGGTALWRLEGPILRRFGVHTVIIPHGGDVYRYSRIEDPVVRHGLLLSFPDAARHEPAIEERVRYWTRHASVIVTGYTNEGLPRWDVPAGNIVVIDTDRWGPATPTDRDGRDPRDPVRILHTPNHRGVKGTEFLIEAVRRLQREGLAVELQLLEGVPNTEVPQAMHAADIFADQFVLPGYGLAAIEALASGLPVIGNVRDTPQDRLFRRYSFLDQCPIVGTTPERLTEDLRRLVTDPALRRRLARASRSYAEHYQGYGVAQFLFDAIRRHLVDDEKVDLMNLFHPILGTFHQDRPVIDHGLENGRLPQPGARPHAAVVAPPTATITVGGAR